MKGFYVITALFAVFFIRIRFPTTIKCTLYGRLAYSLQPRARLSNIKGIINTVGNEHAFAGHLMVCYRPC